MSILIWFLTAVLVLDCLLLILLVLIQLPKKEAGLGQAFGTGATDALFGAGTGNVLTKLTKYSTVVFFVATLLISMLQGHQARARSGDPRRILTMDEKIAAAPKAAAPAAATNAAPATNAIALTNVVKLTNAAPK
jgi:preprotein translocase subunit SecG